MKLREVEYGRVLCASGARGFYGEGYPFHRIWRFFGLNWRGTTFVAKTTTLEPRVGNLHLGKDGVTPTELMPRCIVVKPLSGHVLNAVGLSGPGAEALYQSGRYQRMRRPFMQSFMSVASSKEARFEELRRYVALDKRYMQGVDSPRALVLNFACPNIGLHYEELGDEVLTALDIAADLDVPLIANFSVVTPMELLLEVSEHQSCDALWIGNTIPWGTAGVDWKQLFGDGEVSPLTKRGLPSAGGLSGPTCLLFALERLWHLRYLGVTKPIILGNGIQSVYAANLAFEFGADAIALGVVGIVRPWRMRSIIKAVNH
ncbi:hypothetical protein HY844_00075 [Candidatus Berkelbacteria bacterium]|nr:hypothetical protein [Candidatus Berkelbacteria bacterium]